MLWWRQFETQLPNYVNIEGIGTNSLHTSICVQFERDDSLFAHASCMARHHKMNIPMFVAYS